MRQAARRAKATIAQVRFARKGGKGIASGSSGGGNSSGGGGNIIARRAIGYIL